jgi:hypothetical protein
MSMPRCRYTTTRTARVRTVDTSKATSPPIKPIATCSRSMARCSAVELTDTQAVGTSRPAMVTDTTTEAAPMSTPMAGRAITSHPIAPFTCLSGTGIIERGTVPGTAPRWRVGETPQRDGLSKSLAGKAEGGRCDSHHVKQLALAAVLEAFEASQSQSERVELDIEVVPIDGRQARQCALSERRDGNCLNELGLTKEFDLTKDN